MKKYALIGCVLMLNGLSVYAQGKPDPPSSYSATAGTTSATITWSAVSGSTGYEVQVSPNSNFSQSSPVQVSSTSYTVTGLLCGTTYYYRIRTLVENRQSEWVGHQFTTLNVPPEPPSLSFPSNEATDVPTSLTLSWASVSGATSYDVQLSANSDFSSPILNSNDIASTSASVSGLSNGTTYYWRVRAKNSAGSSGWTSASFTTIVPVPAAPSIVFPPDGATGVETNPELVWTKVPFASSYNLEVYIRDNYSGQPFASYSGSDNNYVLSGLDKGKTYYWQVNAANVAGTSAWQRASFKTISDIPAAPNLVAPSDGERDVPTSVTLVWNKVANALSYSAQVAKDDQFKVNSIVFNATGADTTTAVTGLATDTKYYWRVSASNEAGSSEPSVASFTTITTKPSVPELVAPADGAAGLSTSVQLVWRSVANAKTYSAQVSKGSDFKKNDIVGESSGSDTTYTISGLSPGVTYYWHVNATNDAGTSEFSGTRSFFTGFPKLEIPTLVSPDDRAKNVSLAVTLSWSEVTGAAIYSLQYSTDSKFALSVVEISGITTTHYELSGLQANTTYHWRVNAANDRDTSAWTKDWSFTTGFGRTAAPLLAAPLDKARNVPLNVTLEWKPVTNAISYGLIVRTMKKPVDTVLILSGMQETSYYLKGLTVNTTYQWQVNTTTAVDTSEWSQDWTFTTGTRQLAAPELISPTDRSTGVSTSPKLSWKSVTGAQSYQVQIAVGNQITDQTPKERIDTIGITESSVSVSSLLPKTTYAWRVRSADSSGTSDWSVEGWTFTTGMGRLVAPTLHSPSDDATGVSTNPVLTWTGEPGAQWYAIQVATDQQFRKPVQDTTQKAGTSITCSSLDPTTKYYWRVSAVDSTGASDWSMSWNFTTGLGRLSTPVLISPLDAAVSVSITPTLSWEPSPGVTSYVVQYAKDKNFKKELIEIRGIQQNFVTLSELAQEATYYWQVSAQDSFSISDWSGVWSFSTGTGRLGAPDLVSPLNSSEAPLNPILRWNPTPGALSYWVQVASDKNFRSLVVEIIDLKGTSLPVSGLNDRNQYYWRVRSIGVQDTSGWSQQWQFTATVATSAERLTESIPWKFELQQNFPNPFNPTTTIAFSIPQVSFVRLAVYSVLGSEVEVLVDEEMVPGNYHVRWNASSRASGTYFYRVHALPKASRKTTEYIQTRKLLLLK